MYCVALDPGGTTGVCLVKSIEAPWDIMVTQLGPDPHHSLLLKSLSLWKPSLIICETFQNTGQAAADLAAVAYIGVVETYQQMSGCELRRQSASIAKQFWKDERLRQHNVYAKGQKHARDATRHYLYYRTFTVKDQSLIRGGIGNVVLLGGN